MQEITPGIWHWTARHPKIGVDVSSYYLADLEVLLDPMAPDDVLDRLEQLGPPKQILLTNRHHYRECAKLIDRFGCSVHSSRPGMYEFKAGEPVEPFDFGETLVDGAVTAHEVGGICSDETALHIAPLSALAVADGVINYGGLDFVPDKYMDDPERTKSSLKESYARLVEEVRFDHLLPAHGTPIVGGGRKRLREFASPD